MSYQALARKWRPKNFSELMGQEHVVRALTGSLAQGRLHHAFLFTGTRGVGKTTIARIIAKALNCDTGLSAEPCGQCASCLDIDQGRYPDLLEIDAASRTKVDDTREILDNVLYAPARGRFKVYLIDEVHMLSLSSFNALLKTLEEPPEHVKFILATTDPQKLPVTVLSRCLKFHLKRLAPGQIAKQMSQILTQEAIAFEAEAVEELARAADGSMRDGLSLLDQAIAFGQGALQAEATRDMLGTVSRESIFDLLEAIASNDAHALIEKLAELNQFGGHHAQVLARIAEALHTLAFLQVGGDTATAALEPHPRLLALLDRFDDGALQVNFQLALLGARDVQIAADPRLAFEMCLLRMLSLAPADAQPISVSSEPKPGRTIDASANPQTKTARSVQAQQAQHAITPPVSKRAMATASSAAHADAPSAPAEIIESSGNVGVAQDAFKTDRADQSNAEPQAVSSANTTSAESSANATQTQAQRWCEIAASLPLQGLAKQLALNLSLRAWRASTVDLTLDLAHTMLDTAANRRELKAAWLAAGFTEDLEFTMAEHQHQTPAEFVSQAREQDQQQFESTLLADPIVQSIVQHFDASVRAGSMQRH
jgi:DNA polymerase III subunit gamma/tau